MRSPRSTQRAALLVAGLLASTSAHAACTDLLPSPQAAAGAIRNVTAQDLIELRDIGQPDAAIMLPEGPLALSPDGREIAFAINRADIASNSYCRGLVIIPVAGGPPRLIDRGGELITATGVRRGLVERGGFPELIVPAWSPDGQWVAYLRRDKGVTRVWRAHRNGGRAMPVSPGAHDAEAFAWSADGQRILFAIRPGYAAQRQAIAQEGKSGWIYDRRFVPNWGMHPQETGPVPAEIHAITLATGAISRASADEGKRVRTTESRYSDRASGSVSRNGWRAGTRLTGTSPISPLELWTAPPGGAPRACAAPACRGSITGSWWSGDGATLWFLRREGWAKGEMGLYRLDPETHEVTRALVTSDVLQGCTPTGQELLCLREHATSPRKLVAIDMASGRSRLVFDPNPQFDKIRLGKVTRIKWKNSLGLEAWGDLVLPPGHRPGTRLPMVVVQYHSDGFLRGGTGDDYPVHLFAARGYAVLSFERPTYVASLDPSIRSYDEANAANARNWADRRNVLSALEIGVKMAIERGVADPRRIGITGLSDGATTTRFALINTDLFAAAAISTCCMDPNSVMTYGGIAWADNLRSEGYPGATEDRAEFWKPFSSAVNAARLDTPLLMQVADSEALLALETFTALREHKQPVELYVFPNEYHYKWQPEHRRAVYLRAIDWFDYWLRGIRSEDPARAAELRRWDTLRKARAKQ